jgi:hypothetical protein
LAGGDNNNNNKIVDAIIFQMMVYSMEINKQAMVEEVQGVVFLLVWFGKKVKEEATQLSWGRLFQERAGQRF